MVFFKRSSRGSNPEPRASEEDALSTPLRPTWPFQLPRFNDFLTVYDFCSGEGMPCLMNEFFRTHCTHKLFSLPPDCCWQFIHHKNKYLRNSYSSIKKAPLIRTHIFLRRAFLTQLCNYCTSAHICTLHNYTTIF